MICFGMKPWDDIPDRTQQLMKHLKDMTIFYFYPPTTEYTFPTARKQAWVEEHVYAYALPKPYPNMNHGILIQLRMKKLARYVTRILHKYHVQDFLLWMTHPVQYDLSSFLHYSYLIYDCGGYWESFLQHYQDDLVEKADLVLSASDTLRQDLGKKNKNVMLLRHGVDYELFREISQDIGERGNTNRFGFAGVIHSDLDLSPLVYAAKERPNWKFCLMGLCHRGNPFLAELKKLPNIVFCGEFHPEDVAEFLFSCSVLMEFRRLSNDRESYSTRLYEYCSTGLPIVSCLKQHDIEVFPDVVYSAYHERDFILKCETALAEPENLVSARRRKHGKDGSWKRRSQRISQIFHTVGIC